MRHVAWSSARNRLDSTILPISVKLQSLATCVDVLYAIGSPSFECEQHDATSVVFWKFANRVPFMPHVAQVTNYCLPFLLASSMDADKGRAYQ